MTAIKEKIIGAVKVMTDADAEIFWRLIEKKYASTWESIEEEEPDAIDIQMLNAIKDDLDCHKFTNENDIQWD